MKNRVSLLIFFIGCFVAGAGYYVFGALLVFAALTMRTIP